MQFNIVIWCESFNKKKKTQQTPWGFESAQKVHFIWEVLFLQNISETPLHKVNKTIILYSENVS